MITYTHLAHEERYQIYVLEKADIQQSEIARLLGRSPSTIGRELSRNQGQRGYRPVWSFPVPPHSFPPTPLAHRHRPAARGLEDSPRRIRHRVRHAKRAATNRADGPSRRPHPSGVGRHGTPGGDLLSRVALQPFPTS